LPCGALYYDANGLNKIQIGYRYTTVDFIWHFLLQIYILN
jgi:hypothetical protein